MAVVAVGDTFLISLTVNLIWFPYVATMSNLWNAKIVPVNARTENTCDKIDIIDQVY